MVHKKGLDLMNIKNGAPPAYTEEYRSKGKFFLYHSKIVQTNSSLNK